MFYDWLQPAGHFLIFFEVKQDLLEPFSSFIRGVGKYCFALKKNPTYSDEPINNLQQTPAFKRHNYNIV